MKIRLAEAADIPAITAIYGRHVREGLGTFEEDPPTEAEIARRLAAVQDAGLPYLVAEALEVTGFAYVVQFRPRPAYRFSVEDSVYVAAGQGGKGIGRALLSELIARCEALGMRQMVGIIGDSGNAASIGLHRSLGFRQIGVAGSLGFKHGRWVDIVWMQRSLGNGDGAPPRVTIQE